MCTFCTTEIENIEHIFWQCNIVNQFWVYDKSNYMINIDRQRAIFGISNNSVAMLPVNYVLLRCMIK